MATRYRVGQRLHLWHRGAVREARIVELWRPGAKRNSHMHRIEVSMPQGVDVTYFETAALTAEIAVVARIDAEVRWNASRDGTETLVPGE